MLTDYHSHTTRCRHAVGTMEEYVEQAIARGLDEFGFSDHHSHWMVQRPDSQMAMGPEELPEYVKDVMRLKEKYERESPKPFKLRLGLEIDYVPSRLNEARRVSEMYPWDYLIGSVHHLGFWGLPDPAQSGNYDTYAFCDICEFYFELMDKMIEARFCDIVGHISVINRFGHAPKGVILRHVEPLIPKIKAAGMAVEINTSGKDYPCDEVFPGWDVIEALIASGVPLMLNSDAHAPEQVGRYFAETVERLKRLGVKSLARFEQRRMEMHPID